MEVIHEPDRPEITELYAWIAVGPKGEGIMAANFGDGAGWMPLVNSKLNTAKAMEQLARQAADEQGIACKLVRFTKAEQIEV